MGLITTTGEIMGRNRTTLWLRIPAAKGTHKILTLNDAWLPHGSKRAKVVNIEYDPKSIMPRDDGLIPHLSGWTGNVRFISVVRENEGSEEDRGPD
jgi:hypothetical protein